MIKVRIPGTVLENQLCYGPGTSNAHEVKDIEEVEVTETDTTNSVIRGPQVTDDADLLTK